MTDTPSQPPGAQAGDELKKPRKIFISHSSSDLWIARRVSQDLKGLGCETFLDEKDFETGKSIDDSIVRHLRDANEVLLLLSPAAIKSQWVLVEMGSARALKKPLVPIMINLTANELPQLLSKALARDLNEIDRYYQEVSARRDGTAKRKRKKRPVVPRPRDPPKFDVVTITKGTPRPPGWNDEMDQYVGRQATVTGFFNKEKGWVNLDVDRGKFVWAREWLLKVNT